MNTFLTNFKIFPIKPNGKRPCISDWEVNASNDPDQILQWSTRFPGCNWAIATGPSNLVVLDIDQKDNGSVQFEKLQLLYGVPDTFTITTQSGGRHLYFTGQTRSRIRLFPGIDIKSKGGYVICPPSQIDGRPYVLESNREPVPVPEWLADQAGTPKERVFDPGLYPEAQDRPADLRHAVDLALTYPPAIEGRGGDNHTFKLACQIRDCGISPQMTFEILQDFFNPRCQPPWSEEELHQKVTNAFKYAQFPHGRSQIPFAPFRDPDSPRPFSEIGLVDPPRIWVVDGWIPRGPTAFTLLSGDGGTGKSLLALQLGLAVSSGQPWLGIPVTTGPVLFVTCEDDDDEIDRRMAKIRDAFPFTPESSPFYIASRAGKSSVLCEEDQSGNVRKGPFYDTLNTMLANLPQGPRLLILDTVADVFAGSENTRSSVNLFIKAVIGGLCLRHNTTPILISHPPKQKGVTFSGSTAWNNSVRNRVFLSWFSSDPSPYRTITNEKANYSEAGGKLTLIWERGVFRPVSEEEAFNKPVDLVFNAIALAENSGTPYHISRHGSNPISAARIISTNGRHLDATTILEAAKILINQGKIINVTGGHGVRGLLVASKKCRDTKILD